MANLVPYTKLYYNTHSHSHSGFINSKAWEFYRTHTLTCAAFGPEAKVDNRDILTAYKSWTLKPWQHKHILRHVLDGVPIVTHDATQCCLLKLLQLLRFECGRILVPKPEDNSELNDLHRLHIELITSREQLKGKHEIN